VTPAEELRAAAASIRKLATEANPGPWCTSYAYAAIRHVQRNCDIDVECDRHADRDDCLSFGMYDGPYVAMWHPGVAELVAAVLDNVGKGLEYPSGRGPDPVERQRAEGLYRHELALARAINGSVA